MNAGFEWVLGLANAEIPHDAKCLLWCDDLRTGGNRGNQQQEGGTIVIQLPQFFKIFRKTFHTKPFRMFRSHDIVSISQNVNFNFITAGKNSPYFQIQQFQSCTCGHASPETHHNRWCL